MCFFCFSYVLVNTVRCFLVNVVPNCLLKSVPYKCYGIRSFLCVKLCYLACNALAVNDFNINRNRLIRTELMCIQCTHAVFKFIAYCNVTVNKFLCNNVLNLINFVILRISAWHSVTDNAIGFIPSQFNRSRITFCDNGTFNILNFNVLLLCNINAVKASMLTHFKCKFNLTVSNCNREHSFHNSTVTYPYAVFFTVDVVECHNIAFVNIVARRNAYNIFTVFNINNKWLSAHKKKISV